MTDQETDGVQQIDQATGQTAEQDALLQKLLDIQVKATAIPQKAVRVSDRNAPDRWFARNDGDIVRLQGSPQAIAHYTSKGFHLLTEQEVADWEGQGKNGGIRAVVVGMQRHRANLISQIRRVVRKKPEEFDLNESETPLDLFSTTDLENALAAIRKTSAVVRLTMSEISPQMRYQQALEEEADRKMLANVEVGDGADLEERRLRGKRAGGGRTVSPGLVAESQ